MLIPVGGEVIVNSLRVLLCLFLIVNRDEASLNSDCFADLRRFTKDERFDVPSHVDDVECHDHNENDQSQNEVQ